MKPSLFNIQAIFAAIIFSAIAAHAGDTVITAAARVAPNTKQAADKPDSVQRPQVSKAKSQFAVPTSFSEGRDPFFPESSRPFISDTPAKVVSETTVPDVAFVLKGISGSSEQPLAIINGYTFGSGEENEIIVKSKRIKIRCAEINMVAGTVLIEYGGVRRQLRL